MMMIMIIIMVMTTTLHACVACAAWAALAAGRRICSTGILGDRDQQRRLCGASSFRPCSPRTSCRPHKCGEGTLWWRHRRGRCECRGGLCARNVTGTRVAAGTNAVLRACARVMGCFAQPDACMSLSRSGHLFCKRWPEGLVKSPSGSCWKKHPIKVKPKVPLWA